MHLAFDPETPLLGIPKESIRDVCKDIGPEIFLVWLSTVRKLTKIPNNSRVGKQTAGHPYYVKIILYKSVGCEKTFTILIYLF